MSLFDSPETSKSEPCQRARLFSDKVGTYGRTPPLLVEGSSLKWQLRIKRILDVVLSAAAIVALLPFLMFLWLAIKIDSPGAAIFGQDRWGRNCMRIRIYKFRSMHEDAGDPSGIAQTIENDPRVTRIGRIIRKYNFDELPQLFNVLKGDMSLVGPRCHAVGMLAAGILYEELVPNYHLRHRFRPGMTGLAQIRGLRGPTTDAVEAERRIEADLAYLGNYSLLLDARIIVKTIITFWKLKGN